MAGKRQNIKKMSSRTNGRLGGSDGRRDYSCSHNDGTIYDDEQLEFLRAIIKYKEQHGPVISDVEVFRLAISLGYRKAATPDSCSATRS